MREKKKGRVRLFVGAFAHLYLLLFFVVVAEWHTATHTNVLHLALETLDEIDAFTSYDAITLLIYLFYIFQFTILFDFQLNHFLHSFIFAPWSCLEYHMKKKEKTYS